jgi:hypothetical protein
MSSDVVTEPKILNTVAIGNIIINPKKLVEVANRIASAFDGEMDVNVEIGAYVTSVEMANESVGRFLGFELQKPQEDK